MNIDKQVVKGCLNALSCSGNFNGIRAKERKFLHASSGNFKAMGKLNSA
jgi:hypothetical protein